MSSTTENLIIARRVWDGGSEVLVPPEMGTPRDDQMQGTPAERLTELAGRVCYDSCGKGRSSWSTESQQGYHAHILESGHGSVQEHFHFTLLIMAAPARRALYARLCANHPDVLVFDHRQGVQITLNLRAAIEWLEWVRSFYPVVTSLDVVMATTFRNAAAYLAPGLMACVPPLDVSDVQEAKPELRPGYFLDRGQTLHQHWISLFLAGSRGFSHEQVRHGDFTAISQRSTRYVDESESSWVMHPLLVQYLREAKDQPTVNLCEAVTAMAQDNYRVIVERLEPWLVGKGVDKLTARKQARGAARGFLGNALYTEMIFSASLAQWLWMLKQRCSPAADAEIRLLYAAVLPELQGSRYGHQFEHLKLVPSPDGLGQVIDPTCWEKQR